MPESDHMTQLVDHNAKLVAIFPNGYGLWAPSATTHIRAAPMNQQTKRGSVNEANYIVTGLFCKLN